MIYFQIKQNKVVEFASLNVTCFNFGNLMVIYNN